MRLLSFVHVCNCCRYGGMYTLAVFSMACVDVMVMSSAYEVRCIGAGVCDMLMNVGERTPL